MTRCGIFYVLLGLVALAGCRTKPYVNAHVESLNAEYRQLEDYVYALEEENARLQQERDALRAGRIDRTRSDPPGSDRPRSSAPQRSIPRLPPAPGHQSPADEPPMIEIPDIPATPARPPGGRSTLQRPLGEAPAEHDPEPPTIELPELGAPVEPLPLPAPGPRDAPPPKPEVLPPRTIDRRVTELYLNPAFTTGSRDQGLTVVLEPRNQQQQYVPEPGAVSIVVLDPSRQGDAARVARWDFDAQATQQMLQRTSATPGIKLEMPWPGRPPASEHLHVFVRYETSDGRKLQTDRELQIAAPGETISRWTPRPAERQRPAVAQSEELSGPSVDAASYTAAVPQSADAAATLAKQPPAELSSDALERPLVPAWSPHR